MRQLHFVANVLYCPLRAIVTCAESGASAEFEIVPASGFVTDDAAWDESVKKAWDIAEGIAEFLELHPDVDLNWGHDAVWEQARCQWYNDKDHEVDLTEAKREWEGVVE